MWQNAKDSTLICGENVSTLSCRVTRFIAGSGTSCVTDKNWKEGSFVEWYGCLKYSCDRVSRRDCAKYQHLSTLKFCVEIIGFVKTFSTLMVRISLKYPLKYNMMACAAIVNVAKCVEIIDLIS